MYPLGPLAEADFDLVPPQVAAPAHDRVPLRPWPLTAGPFGQVADHVRALPHRLLPLAAPQRFLSQKIAWSGSTR
ncbi:MAG: hypothetical protein IE927_10675 [Rhodobacterales bacterium]|nr:hypothetical protein [Rhodobacterales bacterium]